MIQLFKEKNIAEAFKIAEENARILTSKLSDNKILNEDIDKICRNIVEQTKIKPLKISFDKTNRAVEINDIVELPRPDYPPHVPLSSRLTMKRARAKIVLNIQNGDIHLPNFKPSSFGEDFDYQGEVTENGEKLIIYFITKYENKELSEKQTQVVKQDAESILELTNQIVKKINQEVTEFNKKHSTTVKERIKEKKKVIEEQKKQNNDLNDF